MKNKLWIFGDSFSTQWEHMGALGDRYREYKGYPPKIFSNYLATMLNMDVKGLGIGGADNFTIFDCIINNIDYIATGDIVIIGWSSPTRFRLEKNNEWITILTPPEDSILPIHLIESYKFVDANTLQQIRVNRMSPLYWDEVVTWSKLITTTLELKGVKVIFWSPFVLLCTDFLRKKPLLPNDWYIGTALTSLNVETKGVIHDAHFSEEAHQQLADILYKKITK
jgi:hypothetical protein